jgi:hypothetical protein
MVGLHFEVGAHPRRPFEWLMNALNHNTGSDADGSVSVVIPTKNVAPHLARLLSSIMTQDPPLVRSLSSTTTAPIRPEMSRQLRGP